VSAPTQVMYIAKCRFCGMTPPPMPPFVPLVGGQIDPKIIAFVQALQKHVEKKHPVEFAKMGQTIMQFTGYAAVSAFEIQDPVISGMQEAVRAALHKFTRRMWITDEEIQDRVARLELETADLDAGVSLLLRDMRDLLTEEGAYAPSQQAKPALVTP
jgi:hypothetical protein